MTSPEAAAKLLGVGTIRAWLASEEALRESNDPVSEAMHWAAVHWPKMTRGFDSLSGSVADLSLPDRLNALSLVAYRDQTAEPGAAASCYRWLKKMTWPGSESFGERAFILSRFAYCAARQFRRQRRFVPARSWETRSATWTVRQPAVSEYLAISGGGCSPRVNDRFLRDPAVLLTACLRLRHELNISPSTSLQRAVSLHSWLDATEIDRMSSDERSYFLSQLALIGALGYKSSGRFEEARRWVDLAKTSMIGVQGAESLAARIEFSRVSIAYEERSLAEALPGVAALTTTFSKLQMPDFHARACLLEGMALKELGRDSEATVSFERVVATRGRRVEPWLRGMALVSISELLGRAGIFDRATSLLGEAWALMKDSGVVTGVAYFHGVSAEIHRDQGDLRSAIASYRLGIDTWAGGGMDALAAYVRILLAETLLAAGEEAAAASEILSALPTIEKLKLMQEGIVAIALLRESLRRQSANPDDLRTLRLQIERMRQGGQP